MKSAATTKTVWLFVFIVSFANYIDVAKADEEGIANITYRNGQTEILKGIRQGEITLKEGLIDRTIGTYFVARIELTKSSSNIFTVIFNNNYIDTQTNRPIKRDDLESTLSRIEINHGNPSLLPDKIKSIQFKNAGGRITFSENPTNSTHTFKLRNNQVVRIHVFWGLTPMILKSGRAEAQLPIEYIKRIEFKEGVATAILPDGKKFFSSPPTFWGLSDYIKGYDDFNDKIVFSFKDIIIIEADKTKAPSKLSRPDDMPDAIITDIDQKTYQVKSVWASIGIKQEGERWTRYLSMYEVNSYERAGSETKIRLCLKNGEVIIGDGGVRELSWHSSSGGIDLTFLIPSPDVQSIKFFHTPIALKKAAQLKEAKTQHPAIVRTADSDIKTSNCLLFIAGSEWNSIRHYLHLYHSISYFSKGDRQCTENIKMIRIEEVSRIEFNSFSLEIRIHLKNGEIVDGILPSLGNSYNGKWDYSRTYSYLDYFYLDQDIGTLLVPRYEVKEIIWK